MFKRMFGKATIVVTAGLVGTLGYGVYQAAEARSKDPVVAPALDGAVVAGVCGNAELLAGPSTAPDGAVVVTIGPAPAAAAPATTASPTPATSSPVTGTTVVHTVVGTTMGVGITAFASATPGTTVVASPTTSTTPTSEPPTTTTTAPVTPETATATDETVQAAIDANPAGTTFYLPDPRYRFTGSVTPKSGDTFIGGPATVIDGGGTAHAAFKAGISFGANWVMADDVTLQSLIVQHFVSPNDQVVVNADAGDGWTFDRMTVQDNHGGAVMMGSRNTIMNSCLTRNGQYGFNTYRCRGYGNDGCTTSTTVTDLVISHSEISANDTDQLAITQPGCGCSGGGKFWDVRGARITDNWVHHNNSVGLWADTNDTDFLFQGNVIEDNDAAGIMYEISYNARIIGNTFRRNAIGQGVRRLAESPGDHFPDGAIYISESGGDAAAEAAARAQGENWTQVNEDQGTLEIAGNTFEDNWNGVILWESSDRYCSSVANTSSGYCTLYHGSFVPGGANKAACTDPVLTGVALDQCRWKTQNVDVHNNLFSIDRDAVGRGCSEIDNHCGRNAVFSQWGVFPSYPAEMVQRKILFEQNNEFHRNIYRGTWRFSAFDQAESSVRDIRTWSAMAPEDASVNYALWNDPPDGLGQDAGSVHGSLVILPPTTTTTTTTTSSTEPSVPDEPPLPTSTTSPEATTTPTTGPTTTSVTTTTSPVTTAPPATTTVATAPPATTTVATAPPATTTTTTASTVLSPRA